MERDKDLRVVRSKSRSAVLREDNAFRQACSRQHGHHAEDRFRSVLHDGSHGPHREDGGLLSAYGSEKAGIRPRGHGEPFYHNNCRRFVASCILRNSERIPFLMPLTRICGKI